MIQVSRSDLKRVMVAIDPAVTHGEGSDDTGIIVVARGPHQDETCKLQETTGRCPGHGYVLDDQTCHVAPHEWARRAVKAYDDWAADRIVAEVNNGGEMVAETIHAVRSGVPYQDVRASRGKTTRAEPVAALYEQGRMHHLGTFPELEAQLTTWTQGDDSPDRLDALVWGCTALGLIGGQGQAFLAFWKGDLAKRPSEKSAQESQKAARQFRQIVSRGPKFNQPKPSCPSDKHMWRQEGEVARCLYCGSER